MKIIRSSQALRKALASLSAKGKKIGFVPTMGYFHEGHLSLMRKASKECDVVVVSLFVNPLQFGPKEDLKKYPRNFKRDFHLARSVKVDYMFVPDVKDIYGSGHYTYVTVEKLSEPLCGRSRPGHFRGVATVVAKLFNIVKPQIAYFGGKDYQQARIIEQMTKDLSYDIRIRVLPTVRETDGLAMSSRNVYLNPEERCRALGIYRALRETQKRFQRGERSVSRLEKVLKSSLQADFKSQDIDYAEIRDTETLGKILKVKKKALAAVAVRLGKTRLIDNAILER